LFILAEAQALRAQLRRASRRLDAQRQQAAARHRRAAARRAAALKDMAAGKLPTFGKGQGAEDDEDEDDDAALRGGGGGGGDEEEEASSGSENEVDEYGVARAVAHPSELVRTKLLEGHVTCSALRCGGLVDASGPIQPERWEGFWCHVISPIYFGRKGQSRIAGTIEKRARGGGGGSIGNSSSSSGGGNVLFLGATSAARRTRPPRDPYTQAPLVPDSRPGAAPGALVPRPPRKLSKVPKPSARPSDAADLARQAASRLAALTKNGKAVVVGFDGQKHLNEEQFAALRRKERAMLNLRQVLAPSS
jgi:hypothetical protein